MLPGERKTAPFLFYMPVLRRVCSVPLHNSRHLTLEPVTSDALASTDEITEPETVTLGAELEAVNAEGVLIHRRISIKAGYIPVTPSCP
jgi:hypothetical protein